MAMPIPESVRIKIERADQHISDMDGAISEFWKTRPYKVIGYIDAEKRPTYQVTDTKPIGPMIPAIAGDVIQCLRAALDRMACALWSRTNARDCKIYFPIADSATKYKSDGLGKVKGLGQDAIDAITAIEPYQGGKGESLWCLHRLSIIDRHRLPLTVIGGQMGIDLIPLYRDRFLLHLLPPGFVRIRNFGFLANRNRATLLPLCFRLLGGSGENAATPASPSTEETHSLRNCPVCGGTMRVVERLSAAQLLLRSPPQPERCVA